MDYSAEQVRALPVVVDLVTAAAVLGIGRTVAYELVRRGEFPVPVLRLGVQLRVPTAPLLELLGLGPVGDGDRGAGDVDVAAPG